MQHRDLLICCFDSEFHFVCNSLFERLQNQSIVKRDRDVFDDIMM